MAADNDSVDLWLSAVDPVVQEWADETGSQDYMSLFSSAEPDWTTVSSNTGVWMITTQFVMGASDAQLSAIISYLNSHDIELGLSGLMLPYGADGIGSGVEGYSTPGTMSEVAQRIAAFGGTLSVVEMDEPLFFGHQYTGANAEQASIQEVANEVAASVAEIEAVFPSVQIGDAEPIPTTSDISTWLADYQTATGQSLAFLDADVQWSTDWQPGLESLSAYLATTGTKLGVIFNGDATATSGTEWESEALERIVEVISDPLVSVQHAFVETWDPEPIYLLPESTFGTLTNLALAYLAITPALNSARYLEDQDSSLVLSSPSEGWDLPGIPMSLSLLGVSLSDSQGSAAEYVVILTSDSGTLQVSASGSDSVSGSGTSFAVINGDMQDVSASLASAVFIENGDSVASIEIIAVNSNGGHQVVTLPVDDGESISAAATISQPEAEVEVAALYEQVYNRDPNSSELSSEASLLLQGTVSLNGIREMMSSSSETINNITSAFQGIFNRTPTNDELVNAESALASGTPLFSIEAPWLAAAEATVTWLYQSILGRQPDAGGLASFSEAMLNGTTAQQARQIIATSAEASGDLSTSVQQYVGITPTTTELTQLEQWLVNGLSLQQLTAIISRLPSADAFQAISELNDVTQFVNPEVIVATPTSDVEIPPIMQGSEGTNGIDQQTIVFSIGGGVYTINDVQLTSTTSASPVASSQQLREYVGLPDGDVIPVNAPAIYISSAVADDTNTTTIQVPASLASTTAIVSNTASMSTALDVTGDSVSPIILNTADSGLNIKLEQPGDVVLSNLIDNSVLGSTPIAFLNMRYPDNDGLGLSSVLSTGSPSGALLRDTSTNLYDDLVIMPASGITISVSDFDSATTASFLYQPYASEVVIEDGVKCTSLFLRDAPPSTSVHVSPDPSGGVDVVLAVGAS